MLRLTLLWGWTRAIQPCWTLKRMMADMFSYVVRPADGSDIHCEVVGLHVWTLDSIWKVGLIFVEWPSWSWLKFPFSLILTKLLSVEGSALGFPAAKKEFNYSAGEWVRRKDDRNEPTGDGIVQSCGARKLIDLYILHRGPASDCWLVFFFW